MTSKLKPINSKALRVMRVLIADLIEVGIDRILNNSDVFLPVHVELIRCDPSKYLIYSVAHYILINDDLVCDPEVCFAVLPDGLIYAISYENAMGTSQPVQFLPDGRISVVQAEQRELTSFANLFLSNIAEQQGVGE